MQTQTELLSELQSLLEAQLELPEPTQESAYAGFISRKSGWQPAHYQDTTFKPTGANTHICLQKALALALELEVPVGLFTLAASQREFTPDQRWALLDNSKDELVHYQALSNWLQGGAQIEPTYLAEAANFRQAISQLQEHEVVKSGYIELGVFFVVLSLFRKFGSPSLKLLAADISTDEASHVLTNWQLIDDQQIPWADSKLNKLRRDVVAWLTEDLRSDTYGQTFWLTQSDRLISTREASGLKFTQTGLYTAFFEVANTSLASY